MNATNILKIFCSYLHRKLCDDVLAPSGPFSEPIRPSSGPNRGPKIVDIRKNSTPQAVIPRGTDCRSACFFNYVSKVGEGSKNR